MGGVCVHACVHVCVCVCERVCTCDCVYVSCVNVCAHDKHWNTPSHSLSLYKIILAQCNLIGQLVMNTTRPSLPCLYAPPQLPALRETWSSLIDYMLH